MRNQNKAIHLPTNHSIIYSFTYSIMKKQTSITQRAYTSRRDAILDIFNIVNYKDALSVAINIMITIRESNIDKDTLIELKTTYKLYCFDLGIDTGYFKG